MSHPSYTCEEKKRKMHKLKNLVKLMIYSNSAWPVVRCILWSHQSLASYAQAGQVDTDITRVPWRVSGNLQVARIGIVHFSLLPLLWWQLYGVWFSFCWEVSFEELSKYFMYGSTWTLTIQFIADFIACVHILWPFYEWIVWGGCRGGGGGNSLDGSLYSNTVYPVIFAVV